MEKENKMGYMPVGRLLITTSIPLMISMLIQALYNIVDSRFVSLINEKAFTAVSIAFPMQNLMMGLALGIGVGINSLLSKSLGEKNFKQANLTAETGIVLSIIHSLIFIIFGLTLPTIYYKAQTSDPEIIKYGVEYLRVVTLVGVGAFFQITFERIITSTGKTIYSMISQSIGAITNIILDPILIFGYFGLPKMGVTGAAVATVIGQCLSAVVAFILNYHFNKEVRIKSIKWDTYTIKKIYEVGLPSFVLISITSVAVFIMNKILNKFSSTAVAAYGAYFKIQSFVFMPVFGLNNGMVPVLAYNYGAGNVDRCKQIIKFATRTAIGILIIGFIIFQVFPKQLLMIFNASDELLKVGIPALRIIAISFILCGYTVASLSVFQALGNGVLSAVCSILRQVVVLVPAAFILSLFKDLNLVWFAYPIAELAGFSYSKYYIKHFALNRINELKSISTM